MNTHTRFHCCTGSVAVRGRCSRVSFGLVKCLLTHAQTHTCCRTLTYLLPIYIFVHRRKPLYACSGPGCPSAPSPNPEQRVCTQASCRILKIPFERSDFSFVVAALTCGLRRCPFTDTVVVTFGSGLFHASLLEQGGKDFLYELITNAWKCQV